MIKIGQEIKFINLKKIVAVEIESETSKPCNVSIFVEGGKLLFKYAFKDGIAAIRFTESIQHGYRENLMFDPIRTIKSNKLD